MIHVGCLPEIDGDPAALRKYVVGFGTASGYEFISDSFRKGDVHQVVAVHVADFTPSEAILRSAKAVWAGSHTRPAFYGVIDSFSSSRDWHNAPGIL